MRRPVRHIVAFNFKDSTKYLWMPEQLTEWEGLAYRFRYVADAKDAAAHYIRTHRYKEYNYSIIQCDPPVHVLLPVKPYYVFQILAEKLGVIGANRKTIEVRKDYPLSKDWSRAVYIYCTKDKQSFNRIPKEYQPLIEKYLGKIAGRFVVETISDYYWGWYSKGRARVADELGHCISQEELKETCLTQEELDDYGVTGQSVYGWHISNLIPFEKPMPLDKLLIRKKDCQDGTCKDCDFIEWGDPYYCPKEFIHVTRAPQSWMYFSEVSGA